METRIVRVNLKCLIEDYVFALSCKDKLGVEEVKNNINSFLSNSDDKIKTDTISYLMKNKVVNEHKDLKEFILNF